MRVIQFAGWSKTGKTTLIEEVLAALPPEIPVGVVKHLGGAHPFELEPGRDTTRFFAGGAQAVTGIDHEKSVTVLKSDTLLYALDRLSDAGCEVALVEGFKREPFAKVVIGDLDTERCLLRNPTAQEVVGAIERFDEYDSPGGLVRRCRERAGGAGGVELSLSYRVEPDRVRGMIGGIEERLASVPGMLAACVHGRVYAGEGTILLAVIAQDPAAAALAVRETGSAGGAMHPGGE
jgi:molybdopterin-guanine dinucleotide biosynthesis protein MobB